MLTILSIFNRLVEIVKNNANRVLSIFNRLLTVTDQRVKLYQQYQLTLPIIGSITLNNGQLIMMKMMTSCKFNSSRRFSSCFVKCFTRFTGTITINFPSIWLHNNITVVLCSLLQSCDCIQCLSTLLFNFFINNNSIVYYTKYYRF